MVGKIKWLRIRLRSPISCKSEDMSQDASADALATINISILNIFLHSIHFLIILFFCGKHQTHSIILNIIEDLRSIAFISEWGEMDFLLRSLNCHKNLDVVQFTSVYDSLYFQIVTMWLMADSCGPENVIIRRKAASVGEKSPDIWS